MAFVARSLQGLWWGFISRNYVVWPTFFLMNVFIALKGSHFWFLFESNYDAKQVLQKSNGKHGPHHLAIIACQPNKVIRYIQYITAFPLVIKHIQYITDFPLVTHKSCCIRLAFIRCLTVGNWIESERISRRKVVNRNQSDQFYLQVLPSILSVMIVLQALLHSWAYLDPSHLIPCKVDKKAMIRNRYNRIPHPVPNSKWERTRITKTAVSRKVLKGKSYENWV